RYQLALEHQNGFQLDLSTGVPDPELLPSLSTALASLTRTATTGSYLDDPVLPALSDLLLDDWPYAVDELAIVDGAMDALDLIVRSTVRFGDRVVVEDPCFPPLVDLLEAVGAQLVGVPLDGEGLALEPLATALAEPVAAVILQPRSQNPTGVTMTARRARAVARLLDGTSTLVVEDDSAAGLSPSPLVSLGRWRPEHTAYVRSFSKSHGPDLRLAALSAPAEVMRSLTVRRQLGQGWSSRLLQQILVSLLTDEGTQASVAQARRCMPRDAPPSSTPCSAREFASLVTRGSISGCRSTTRRLRWSDWPARASEWRTVHPSGWASPSPRSDMSG
ncbi:MAG TPA: aminotransferase class I/II-fold pyridoxal phosphate-dependent enzyme, partial [Pedococcus sp.]|nr:aminotransferase class I/II-fold pyridoxal phosphate-dependent enzyme [Pedococcus sp.]